MDPVEQFEKERAERIASYASKTRFQEHSKSWTEESYHEKYVYNFSWLGRPIIQNPIDMVGLQEIIFRVKPDLIIETGIAHGGSIIFSASILELMGHGEVLGIDIDIRAHNRLAIESHPMFKRIRMLEGSSTDKAVIEQVHDAAAGKENVLVILDSNHTHEHVLTELRAYAPLVSVGSYCIVYDTFVEDLPKGSCPDRPWDKGNNPKTAVFEYLDENTDFLIDKAFETKLMITVAPDGFLRRIR